MPSKLPVIFIMGPTASGKTSLAIDLVKKGLNAPPKGEQQFNGFEIISVDSALVFKQMNIGSAKPTEQELLTAPHHLIDFVDPKDSYSVSQFYSDANKLIKDIHQRQKIPLLVGGTMLYFKSLINGIAEMPATNDKVRKRVQQRLDDNGIESLHDELKTFDAMTADRLHFNDTQRITRAIEVYEMSGKPLSQWHEEQANHEFPYKLLSIAIAPNDRKVLHKRIEQRFNQMLENSFLDEMSALYARNDLNLDCPSMRSVGYRQFWQYLDGELTLSEAKEKAIIATRQLAKRQLTWLRSWQDLHWFDLSNTENDIEKQLNACRRLIEEFVIDFGYKSNTRI